MIITTTAKINLGLYVFGTREDGFHNIESVFYPVDQFNSNLVPDIIKIEEGCFCGGGKVRILQSGITIASPPEENICVKAYHVLDNDFKLPPIFIQLEKNVAIGGGLGGGSADGVCVLRALNEMFKIGLSPKELENYACQLGSDCPFFVYNYCSNDQIYRAPMLVEGRGEKLSSLNSLLEKLKDCRIKIISNNYFISTPHAYSIVKERDTISENKRLKNLLSLPVSKWQEELVNDFEAPIFKEFPQLSQIKQQLLEEGAIYASMTGSGSAIYGIFKK